MSTILPEYSVFRKECMPRFNKQIPLPTAKELSLEALQLEIQQNESYIMNVGAMVSSLEACLATMQYVLTVARLAMQQKHTTAAGRRAVRDMRKAMAALKAM
jgi:hypothetical protein